MHMYYIVIFVLKRFGSKGNRALQRLYITEPLIYFCKRALQSSFTHLNRLFPGQTCVCVCVCVCEREKEKERVCV